VFHVITISITPAFVLHEKLKHGIHWIKVSREFSEFRVSVIVLSEALWKSI
jgi:hypothetical protein